MSTNPPLASALYEGEVIHRRMTPSPHAFRYRIAQLYIDFDELDALVRRRWLFSRDRSNVAALRRSDYLAPHTLSIPDAVRARIERETGIWPSGPVRMLAHWRYFGYVFNPVTFYYVFADDGTTLAHVVAEITNTPWRERHAYVLEIEHAHCVGQMRRWSFPKSFHVSPFLPMDCNYRWALNTPSEALLVHMDVERHGEKAFDATMRLDRRSLTPAAFARVLWRFPLMTAQVTAAIYWQALRLWIRGTPLYAHPDESTPR